jgi:bifunctional DNA-binding transcriptional regulator/antitoxin component of YhaV-PrlF toxin-antitoxin module
MASKTRHVMKISSNGQISLPADVRARWGVDKVYVIDMSRISGHDHLVIAPVSDDPIAKLRGKDKRRGGPNSDEWRQMMRDEELEVARRKGLEP